MAERINDIGAILTVIQDVADRTNLLALNASIIAAQAGEHGRSFDVVAAEIKALAQRTAASTKQISEQIRGVHPSTVRRRGEGILDAIARGHEAEPIPRESARGRSEPGDAPAIALAEALLRARALDSQLAYELIASRSELEQIVAAARRSEPEPDVRTLTGWRRELVGEDLRDLLAGRKAVAIGPGRRLELRGSPEAEDLSDASDA